MVLEVDMCYNPVIRPDMHGDHNALPRSVSFGKPLLRKFTQVLGTSLVCVRFTATHLERTIPHSQLWLYQLPILNRQLYKTRGQEECIGRVRALVETRDMEIDDFVVYPLCDA